MRIKDIIICIIALLPLSVLWAQQGSGALFPGRYAVPVKGPLRISGTHGELRDNHYHAGTDISPALESVPVYAASDGYVSRIRISHSGYGKVIYVDHPDGRTTVYAHLQRFGDAIQSYVKKIQYARQSYQMEAWPARGTMRVVKGQIIAYSGNTGSSGGPHLHFEVRRTASGASLNALALGLPVVDNAPPVVRGLYLVRIPDEGAMEQPSDYVQIPFPAGDSIPLVTAIGRVGIAIDAYDSQTPEERNKNGLYRIDLSVDGRPIFCKQVDSTDFTRDRAINTHILYDVYRGGGPRIEKCYIDPSDPADLYDRSLGNGTLTLVAGDRHTICVELRDAAGNLTVRRFTLAGQYELNTPPLYPTTERRIARRRQEVVVCGRFTATFPAGTFYRDLWFALEQTDSLSVGLHRKTTPVNTPFTVEFDASGLPSPGKLYMSCNGAAMTTSCSGKLLSCSLSSLGEVKVARDVRPPVISQVKIPSALTAGGGLIRAVVRDADSGLAKYNATVDGRWILLEYDYKSGSVVADLSDLAPLAPGDHRLTITATDRCGNQSRQSHPFTIPAAQAPAQKKAVKQ
ncbi:peptidase M23 [Bacteroidia bacterium]|nr:peptidase M23 [Bacteroidia bacterium]